DEHWSGDAGVDWTPAENLLVYGKVTRGFKSGGFFGGFAASRPETAPYKEETVWDYEIGVKSEWLDRTLQANAAGVYYDYADVQGFKQVVVDLNGVEINVTKLDNIGDATHKGAETSLTWLPTAVQGLSLTAGASWLDTEINSNGVFPAQDFTFVSYD